MVLGEKHGTNYLPYTFFLVYNEKERKRTKNPGKTQKGRFEISSTRGNGLAA